MFSHFCDCRWLYLYLVPNMIMEWPVPELFMLVEDILVWLSAGPFLTFSACQQDVFHFLKGTPFFFSLRKVKGTALLSLFLQQHKF